MTELVKSQTGSIIKDTLNEWIQFINSIHSSTDEAVSLISDMISFDKLSTIATQVSNSQDKDMHNVWNLLSSTIDQFQCQAKSKGISLSLHQDRVIDVEVEKVNENPKKETTKTITPPLSLSSHDTKKVTKSNNSNEEAGVFSNLVVAGDLVKWQQIIKNLITNAMKNTPTEGQVDVTGTHISTFVIMYKICPCTYILHVSFLYFCYLLSFLF